MSKYYCPACGAELEQGQFEFNYESGDMCLTKCPNGCDCEGMRVHDSEEAAEKYCRDSIEDFNLRYDLALNIENWLRCSLEHADPILYGEISDRLHEWSNGNEDDEFNPEDIF